MKMSTTAPQATLDQGSVLSLVTDTPTTTTIAFRTPSADLTTKKKGKRSRNGCVNCKRLKIKCDESKPSCEYCMHTKRMCLYLPPKPRAKKARIRDDQSESTERSLSTSEGSDIEKIPDRLVNRNRQASGNSYTLINHHVQNLNSLLAQLDVTNFELRLLKYFTDFGGNFFSFGKNPQVHDFWQFEVPKMWSESELMRTAMYALSSIQLWTQYRLNEITNVYVDENQSLVIYEDFDGKKGTTLYERTNTYFQTTLTLLKIESLDESKLLDPNISGQIIAANIIVFAFVSVHPISPVSVIAFQDGSNGFMVDILEICRNFHLSVYSRYRAIMNTKYVTLTFQAENTLFPPESTTSLFAFIEYLKYYIDSHFDQYDAKHLTYHNCTTAMELGCYRGLELGYVMPIYRTVLNIAKDPDFIHLVRFKDYTALKLMFYYSCLCSISGFKLFRDNSIWDNFVDDFKKLSFKLFHGKFEDLYDQVMYDSVISFKEGKIRFEMEMLKTLGEVDYRGFANSEAPLIRGAILGYPPPPL